MSRGKYLSLDDPRPGRRGPAPRPRVDGEASPLSARPGGEPYWGEGARTGLIIRMGVE